MPFKIILYLRRYQRSEVQFPINILSYERYKASNWEIYTFNVGLQMAINVIIFPNIRVRVQIRYQVIITMDIKENRAILSLINNIYYVTRNVFE